MDTEIKEQKEVKEQEEESMAKHADNFMLKMSSSKLGQTNYDPNKELTGDAPPISLKQFGMILLALVIIILVAAGVMLLFTKTSYPIAITVLVIVAVISAIVIMHFRK